LPTLDARGSSEYRPGCAPAGPNTRRSRRRTTRCAPRTSAQRSSWSAANLPARRIGGRARPSGAARKRSRPGRQAGSLGCRSFAANSRLWGVPCRAIRPANSGACNRNDHPISWNSDARTVSANQSSDSPLWSRFPASPVGGSCAPAPRRPRGGFSRRMAPVRNGPASSTFGIVFGFASMGCRFAPPRARAHLRCHGLGCCPRAPPTRSAESHPLNVAIATSGALEPAPGQDQLGTLRTGSSRPLERSPSFWQGGFAGSLQRSIVAGSASSSTRLGRGRDGYGP